ncbi:lipase family protein [Nocardioides sp.]|uniref:lipase family protein n=1 Tax=Nocardioides sp. TaxID=35761 RepID=UPI003D0E2327
MAASPAPDRVGQASDPVPAPIIEVSGGASDPTVERAAALTAAYAEVRALADTYDDLGSRLRDRAALNGQVLLSPELLESSVLSPATFAAVEAAVGAATAGPDGVLESSVAWETDARLIRAAIDMIEEQDRLAHQSMELVDYALGRAVGTALPMVVAGAALAMPVVMSPRVRPWALPLARSLAESGTDWMLRHPTLERHLFNGAGGLLDGLAASTWPGPGGPAFLPSHLTTEEAASTLARIGGTEGPALLSHLDEADTPVPATPRSLADLVENLAAINGTTDLPQPDGAITVQRLDSSDGTIRWILYAPGTDQFLPQPEGGSARDGAADLLLTAGRETTYGDGVRQAMKLAGIQPGQPVLMVGHSMGGMLAVDLVRQHPELDITNVITLGSPIAPGDIPDRAQVLSLENAGDIVPLTSGERNSPTSNHVTVYFDDSRAGGQQHDVAHYLHGAHAADLSTAPGIVEQRRSLDGFLEAHKSAAQSFVVTR